MNNVFIVSFRMFVVLSVLTGMLYPALVTALAMTVFPAKAQGSLLMRDGKRVGSELLAQKFSDPRYVWPRPSAGDYATVASGASNQGRISKKLKEQVAERKKTLLASGANSDEVPSELLCASGSGLDPHLRPEAVLWQLTRVAKTRVWTQAKKEKAMALVQTMTEAPVLGFLGEPRVNVLLLNLALDRLDSAHELSKEA